MAKNSTCARNEALDALADKYALSREECIIIQKFIDLKAEKRADITDCIVDMAAAIQKQDDFAHVISPETTTNDEKVAAFKECLDVIKKSNGKIFPIKFPLVEPDWRRWVSG